MARPCSDQDIKEKRGKICSVHELQEGSEIKPEESVTTELSWAESPRPAARP